MMLPNPSFIFPMLPGDVSLRYSGTCHGPGAQHGRDVRDPLICSPTRDGQLSLCACHNVEPQEAIAILAGSTAFREVAGRCRKRG